MQMIDKKMIISMISLKISQLMKNIKGKQMKKSSQSMFKT